MKFGYALFFSLWNRRFFRPKIGLKNRPFFGPWAAQFRSPSKRHFGRVFVVLPLRIAGNARENISLRELQRALLESIFGLFRLNFPGPTLPKKRAFPLYGGACWTRRTPLHPPGSSLRPLVRCRTYQLVGLLPPGRAPRAKEGRLDTFSAPRSISTVAQSCTIPEFHKVIPGGSSERPPVLPSGCRAVLPQVAATLRCGRSKVLTAPPTLRGAPHALWQRGRYDQ